MGRKKARINSRYNSVTGRVKKGQPKTKADLRKHAKRRALERYGVSLNSADLDAMCEIIQDNKAKHLYTQSSSRTLWELGYNGGTYAVVYNKNLSMIATFLPIGVLDEQDAEG